MRPTALVVCLLLSASSAAAGQEGPRAGDEAAVRDVVARYVAARELKDPQAVEALFTADADQYTTSGEWRRGRAAIVSGTARSSAQNPGTRRIRVEAVRFVTADVAVADGPYEIETAPGTASRRMWTSIVVVRTPQGWRISAIRNMVPTGRR
ncbi:MAG: SgcJ/EcaC family oxidoreductase [Vicinamibacterales bacterium]